MMKTKLSDKVRAVAIEKYVKPAREAGAAEFSIAVKSLLRDLQDTDFPLNYTPLVCNSIKTNNFQRDNGMEITSVDGPKSQTGTRVVVHYKFSGGHAGDDRTSSEEDRQNESPDERAQRLTQKIRGILRQEIAEMGGAEAFIQWVRSDDKDAA